MQVVSVPIDILVFDPSNARQHDNKNLDAIKGSLAKFSQVEPLVVNRKNNVVIGGNGRLAAMKALGFKEAQVNYVDLTDTQATALAIALNRTGELASWNEDVLTKTILALQAEDFDLEEIGFDDDDIKKLLGELDDETDAPPKIDLREKWGFAPFSVFNTRDGGWQERKRAWKAMGIDSGDGREDCLLGLSGIAEEKGLTGTSIFDPVLCELIYSWFVPEFGTILDPFAGGSVRGIVASFLDRRYYGNDLRSEQVEANRRQAAGNDNLGMKPTWTCGDSRDILTIAGGQQYDFVFSCPPCPPYADLEVYSEDANDLSNMDYADFREAYAQIIRDSVALLKEDAFACFVVGEVRGKDGNYYGFVGDTIQAFELAGARFYNEAILVNSVGTVAMRANRYFTVSRKLGKLHQNILIFIKGDARRATAKLPEPALAALEGDDEDQSA